MKHGQVSRSNRGIGFDSVVARYFANVLVGDVGVDVSLELSAFGFVIVIVAACKQPSISGVPKKTGQRASKN